MRSVNRGVPPRALRCGVRCGGEPGVSQPSMLGGALRSAVMETTLLMEVDRAREGPVRCGKDRAGDGP